MRVLFFVVLLWIAVDSCVSAVAEEEYYPNPRYTVSPTGKFIAASYRNREGNQSRVAILDTALPASRQTVGDDYPEFPGIAFSSDEEWVLVADQNSYFDPKEHPSLHLLRSDAGSKFEPVASPNFPGLTSGTGVTGLAIRSVRWESGSSDFIVSVMESLSQNSDNFRVWEIRSAAATKQDQPGDVLTDNKYTGGSAVDDLLASEQKEVSQNVEHQLNAVYKVLKRNLDKSAQDDLILEERKWLLAREKLLPGFDQSYLTERRVHELAKRLLVLQGTANHWDTDAPPSYIEFVPPAQGSRQWTSLIQWENRKDEWQPDYCVAAISADSSYAAIYWKDAMDGYHTNLCQLVEKTLYRLDPESSAAVRAKVLAAILKPHNLPAASCDSSTLKPNHWEGSENVAIEGLAAGHNDQLDSYQLNGWSVLYNVKKREVVQVLKEGKFDCVSKNAAAQIGEISDHLEIRSEAGGKKTVWTWYGDAKDQATQRDADSSSVSRDGVWVVVSDHISTASFLNLYRRQKNGNYALMESTGGDDPLFDAVTKAAFTPHGLDPANDLGDHYGTGFEGWSGDSHQLIIGFHSRLDQRSAHGDFYQFGGWSGVYDLDKGEVVKQLTPGSVWELVQ